MSKLQSNYEKNMKSHKPVMINEVIGGLNIRSGYTYVDATFGAGGYSRAMLNKLDCNVIGVDKDPDVIEYAEQIKLEKKDRFEFYSGGFGNLESILKKNNKKKIDGGIVLDLGISSMQIDNQDRGFSYSLDGPLDMRMSKSGLSAYDIVNDMEEEAIEAIIKNLGEERKAKLIARKIIESRSEKKIVSTLDLVKIIEKVVKRSKNIKKHPATRTFQALRIYINQELEELEKILSDSESILMPGARLVIVSFHSLEDRIVKNFFNNKSGNIPNVNRHFPQSKNLNTITFKKISKKVIKVGEEELRDNVRSRSAKLRVAERTSESKKAA